MDKLLLARLRYVDAWHSGIHAEKNVAFNAGVVGRQPLFKTGFAMNTVLPFVSLNMDFLVRWRHRRLTRAHNIVLLDPALKTFSVHEAF